MQVQKVIYVFILSTDASTKSNISIHIKHRCKYKGNISIYIKHRCKYKK